VLFDHGFRGLDHDEDIIALLELHVLDRACRDVEASSPTAVSTITSETTRSDVTDTTLPGMRLCVLIMR
jgi:hypothetical protein